MQRGSNHSRHVRDARQATRRRCNVCNQTEGRHFEQLFYGRRKLRVELATVRARNPKMYLNSTDKLRLQVNHGKWGVAVLGPRQFVLRECVYVDALGRLDVYVTFPAPLHSIISGSWIGRRATFGVVEPIDSEDDLLVVGDLEELRRDLCELLEAVEGNADGQRLDVHSAACDLDQHLVAVHAAAQPPRAAVYEVEAVVFHVEADHVACCNTHTHTLLHLGATALLLAPFTGSEMLLVSETGSCALSPYTAEPSLVSAGAGRTVPADKAQASSEARRAASTYGAHSKTPALIKFATLYITVQGDKSGRDNSGVWLDVSLAIPSACLERTERAQHERLLAPHQGEPGSISGGVAPGFSHVGIAPDDAAGCRVFSGFSHRLRNGSENKVPSPPIVKSLGTVSSIFEIAMSEQTKTLIPRRSRDPITHFLSMCGQVFWTVMCKISDLNWLYHENGRRAVRAINTGGTVRPAAADISDGLTVYLLFQKHQSRIGKRAADNTETNVFSTASRCERSYLFPREFALASSRGANSGAGERRILTEHSLQDLVIPGEQPHDVPRRERDMQEEGQFGPQFLLFYHLDSTTSHTTARARQPTTVHTTHTITKPLRNSLVATTCANNCARRATVNPRREGVVVRKWGSCLTMPLVVEFSLGSPISPAWHSSAAPYSSRFTLVGSQDLDVKSSPNLPTLPPRSSYALTTCYITLREFSSVLCKQFTNHGLILVLDINEINIEAVSVRGEWRKANEARDVAHLSDGGGGDEEVVVVDPDDGVCVVLAIVVQVLHDRPQRLQRVRREVRIHIAVCLQKQPPPACKPNHRLSANTTTTCLQTQPPPACKHNNHLPASTNTPLPACHLHTSSHREKSITLHFSWSLEGASPRTQLGISVMTL
ncbi:hypothetical protein PR048_007130 [Dryococelus australis]|uniref:Uncharacterized protein n=1 Tax=Dryococelus australis TaxID=614101 RepID=A0ABQ9ICT8_9NEOP|nr:hypothetical protein PR048_007130 [Dryococelus australis]